jgi:hypothetical protein
MLLQESISRKPADFFENPRAVTGQFCPRLTIRMEKAAPFHLETKITGDAVVLVVWKEEDGQGKTSNDVEPQSVQGAFFLDTIYLLEEIGESRRAVEHSVNYLDNLLNDGRFGECQDILGKAEVEQISPSVLVSFLGITLAAKHLLGQSRAGFFERVQLKLKSSLLEAERTECLLNKYK